MVTISDEIVEETCVPLTVFDKLWPQGRLGPFKRVCRLVGALSNPGRVVVLVHPVHLAYGLKTRYFLK